jgi:hypothetical protein
VQIKKAAAKICLLKKGFIIRDIYLCFPGFGMIVPKPGGAKKQSSQQNCWLLYQD